MNVRGAERIDDLKDRIREARNIPSNQVVKLVLGDLSLDYDSKTVNDYQIPVDGIVTLVKQPR